MSNEFDERLFQESADLRFGQDDVQEGHDRKQHANTSSGHDLGNNMAPAETR